MLSNNLGVLSILSGNQNWDGDEPKLPTKAFQVLIPTDCTCP